MNRPIDMRRCVIFTMTVILAFAVIGPACLLTATSAFAADMQHPMDAPARDCESTNGNMGICPHAEKVATESLQPASQDFAQMAMLPALAPAIAPACERRTISVTAVDAPDGAVPPPTPLRL